MSENKSVPKKDSFNFGDDLCQLILSYLQFYDKFKLEGVCRQWKRLIFNSVVKLDFPFDGVKHNRYSYDQHLKSIDPDKILMISKDLITEIQFY